MSLKDDIEAIKSYVRLVNLPLSSTLEDLVRAGTRQIEIPFVKERLDARAAYWVLGVVTSGPLILLISLSASMLAVAQSGSHKPEQRESSLPTLRVDDWLPLHPGILASILGILWLLAPGVLAVVGGIETSNDVPLAQRCLVSDVRGQRRWWGH